MDDNFTLGYDLINFENGIIEEEGKVVIDGVEYPVIPRKIKGKTPTNATTLGHMDRAIAYLFEKDSGGGTSGINSVPVGTILEWHSSILPEDGTWLWCDHEYLKADYPELAEWCGDRFNKSDTPINSFRTPNRAGYVVIGAGTFTAEDGIETTFNLGDKGGSPYTERHRHEGLFDNVGNPIGKGKYEGNKNPSIQTEGLALGGFYTGFAGKGKSGNYQPYVVANFIIKAKK